MAATKVTDIIEPEVWTPYMIEETAEKSVLIQSGIAVQDPTLTNKITEGGRTIDMPFFQDLSGDDEVLSDTVPLTVNKIDTDQDKAVVLRRGKVFGASDLSAALAGTDPLNAIANRMVAYWNRREQAALISLMTGMFADNIANNASDLVHDVSIAAGLSAVAANLISASAIIAAAGLLGDNMGDVTALSMHSVPYQKLLNLDLIEFRADSEGKLTLPFYLGKSVLVDDTHPVVAGGTNGFVYTTYLYRQGIVARGEGMPKVGTETDRDSLQGEDVLIHRRHFLLHIHGIAFQDSSVAGLSPTNAELELPANWSRVYEQKNIACVKLLTNG